MGLNSQGIHRLAPNTPRESPPPPSRIFSGHDELVEEIVGLAGNLEPIALIGAGGIGKTSIALTVLHDDRIKRRFGHNRRFIHCDQFPASLPHFSRRLSKAIGSGIENPEGLAPLRSFLSSKEMIIVLDNTESILDPQGPNFNEIYPALEELSRINNVCLCITSRTSTVPPGCVTLEIPTLSIKAARRTFYRIYKKGARSESVDIILKKLKFHPLSITLLATVAHENEWSIGRLTREWEGCRTRLLHTDHNKSLSVTIELSLESPMFKELGPGARQLLGIVAFLPQGVNEENLERFFSTVPNGAGIFDKFCILSLTYRSEGFVKMLAPLRDHLSPRNPLSSPLLLMVKDHYLAQFTDSPDLDRPEFGGVEWLMSEDANVEHLLDIFTPIGACPEITWNAFAGSIAHSCEHKSQLIKSGPHIEGLPGHHPPKLQCLLPPSGLFVQVGNYVQRKQFLTHLLKFWRDRGDLYQVALTLMRLTVVDQLMGLLEEAIQLANEALEIFRQLKDTVRQAWCLSLLVLPCLRGNQVDATGETPPLVTAYHCHQILHSTYHYKGNCGKVAEHLKAVPGIDASSRSWHGGVARVRYSPVFPFAEEGRFSNTNAHSKWAKPGAAHNANNLAYTMTQQAHTFHHQRGRLSTHLCGVGTGVNCY